jgi:hypothetical protein
METRPFIPSLVNRGPYRYKEHGPRGSGYYLLSAQPQQVLPGCGFTTRGVTGRKAFYPSRDFAGHFPGYVFTTRDQGTGYYLDCYSAPGVTGRKAFYPSRDFAGHFPGYVFTTRDQGTGYYLESK